MARKGFFRYFFGDFLKGTLENTELHHIVALAVATSFLIASLYLFIGLIVNLIINKWQSLETYLVPFKIVGYILVIVICSLILGKRQYKISYGKKTKNTK